MDTEDILNDTIGLFGDEVVEDESIHYGPLTLTTAPKVMILHLKNCSRDHSSILTCRQF